MSSRPYRPRPDQRGISTTRADPRSYRSSHAERNGHLVWRKTIGVVHEDVADLHGSGIKQRVGGFPHPGLQDIAETIHSFASEEIKDEYLPKFCSQQVVFNDTESLVRRFL